MAIKSIQVIPGMISLINNPGEVTKTKRIYEPAHIITERGADSEKAITSSLHNSSNACR